ncbi:MAG: DNA double-strand break repair nuclease NurA [Armatimonadetes bacterium]|nr:DNA double-strand break repair nuclease NurA [Armatimonadota bacterium]
MGYSSRHGKRPYEYASRSAHGHVIKDPSVQQFLEECELPRRADQVILPKDNIARIELLSPNPIRHVIAVDGGYSEVPVQTEFPSATIAFFQFGALFFSVEDLEKIEDQAFIDPEDMSKLKNIQRLKFTMPVKNVVMKSEGSLTNSVRKAIYDFFRHKPEDGALIESLKWFLFQEYRSVPLDAWIMGSCPVCNEASVPLRRALMTQDYSFSCEKCGNLVYLTDVFRLHEAIDDELGAGGILGYVATTVEQILIVHLLRLLARTKPTLLGQVLFVKDGPLAYFGQTANMHKPMRELVSYLFDHYDLFLVGLEKSGAFVEHADEIAERLEPGTILVLDNAYIYRYILPGKPDLDSAYGRTTYYSNKLIFKTTDSHMHVVSLPTTEILANPNEHDFRNLRAVLTNVEKLKCDMYDSALVPIALANKLVSLANHPSSKILQRFAMGTITH